jgi:hypothetical protein
MNSAAHTAQFGSPQEKEARRKFYADYYASVSTVDDLRRQKKKADAAWANAAPIESDYLVENQRVKDALKEEEGTGSHYDGYTVEDHKRDIGPFEEAMARGEDQSEGFKRFTAEDGNVYDFNKYQQAGDDPLPLEVQNMILRADDGTVMDASDGTFHFEGPPPPDDGAPLEMSEKDFQKRQEANQWQPIDPNDKKWKSPPPPDVTPQDLPEWEHLPLADTDWATGTPAPTRMIRDNPDLKRYHPDYGGTPNRGTSRPTPVGAAAGLAAGIRPGMNTGPDRYNVDPRHMR